MEVCTLSFALVGRARNRLTPVAMPSCSMKMQIASASLRQTAYMQGRRAELVYNILKARRRQHGHIADSKR
jgi:hypothetical protein